MSRDLDRKKDKITQYNDKLQILKTTLNDQKEEKLEIEKELQERKQLDERKEELEGKNDALSVEIQVRYYRPQPPPASGAPADFTQKGGGRGLRPRLPPQQTYWCQRPERPPGFGRPPQISRKKGVAQA